jgi:hypothetical protein
MNLLKSSTGRFVASLENFGSPDVPCWKFWARCRYTQEAESFGLSPRGYSSALAAIDAMSCAEHELRAQEVDETPTDERGCIVNVHDFRNAKTDKVEVHNG